MEVQSNKIPSYLEETLLTWTEKKEVQTEKKKITQKKDLIMRINTTAICLFPCISIKPAVQDKAVQIFPVYSTSSFHNNISITYANSEDMRGNEEAGTTH